jgi:hypothetical protein
MRTFLPLSLDQICKSNLARTTGLAAIYEWLELDRSWESDILDRLSRYKRAQVALRERRFLAELGIIVPCRLLILKYILQGLDTDSDIRILHELGSIRESFRELARSKYPALGYELPEEEQRAHREYMQMIDEMRAEGFDPG